ncbi:jg14114 [Pararge aegeria aegeria]|uniref:Jg14114 protein n=1 Tax=Pararge aegeria aegeria TaxID=348720 RepID=A0A8S4S0A4_9NEOP|nr:jg14114 [Pararge aegeria aegeria]
MDGSRDNLQKSRSSMSPRATSIGEGLEVDRRHQASRFELLEYNRLGIVDFGTPYKRPIQSNSGSRLVGMTLITLDFCCLVGGFGLG